MGNSAQMESYMKGNGETQALYSGDGILQKGGVFDSRGIRQMPMQAWSVGSLLAEIKSAVRKKVQE